MRFSSPVRTDLVISMTLAETFLLLLFVVWYGQTAILRQDPLAVMKERLASVEKENERLNKELKQANDHIADLKLRLDIWRKLTGLENPPTLTPDLIARWRKEVSRLSTTQGSGGRGRPKCEEMNVVVRASMVQGQFSVEWMNQSQELSNWLADSGRPQPKVGFPITDRRTIQAFLDGVRAYYLSKKVKGTECRFDYQFIYSSPADYFHGREFFEAYFSPGGRRRSKAGETLQQVK